jgi:hypothetical protein
MVTVEFNPRKKTRTIFTAGLQRIVEEDQITLEEAAKVAREASQGDDAAWHNKQIDNALKSLQGDRFIGNGKGQP